MAFTRIARSVGVFSGFPKERPQRGGGHTPRGVVRMYSLSRGVDTWLRYQFPFVVGWQNVLTGAGICEVVRLRLHREVFVKETAL